MVALSDSSKQIYQRLKDDFEFYARNCLVIRPKNPVDGKNKVPFCLNFAQAYLHKKIEEQLKETGKVRVIILKGRQQGMSTYVQARFFWKITKRRGVKGFILTHEDKATKALFNMSKRFYANVPVVFRPQISKNNSYEMDFSKLDKDGKQIGLDSGYSLGTASNPDVGRGETLQFFHGSEVSRWDYADQHAMGVMQAVPSGKASANTEIILESTANGVGNYFHEMWQQAESGKNQYLPIFIPWFWQDEYQEPASEDFVKDEKEELIAAIYDLTNDQLQWRRTKISELSVMGQDGERMFEQEYPNCPAEAFKMSGESAFINTDLVSQARKAQCEPYGPLLIGVDPAGMGRDRTAIARRKGRVAFNIDVYIKKDTMELVGILHMIILKERPTKMFIDSGGLGVGIVDRLRELGHADVVVAVNSASSPLDQNRYANKRAEMWGNLLEWLMDYPCKISDSDELHADLCGIKAKNDSKGRLLMERKEDMAKRRVRSPDLADALALTVAHPEMAAIAIQEKHHSAAATMFGNHLKEQKRLKANAWK